MTINNYLAELRCLDLFQLMRQYWRKIFSSTIAAIPFHLYITDTFHHDDHEHSNFGDDFVADIDRKRLKRVSNKQSLIMEEVEDIFM